MTTGVQLPLSPGVQFRMSLDTPDTRWMTYREVADRLGMKEESARRQAQQERWPRQLGNDGRTRVGVPGGAVAQEAARSGAADGRDDHPGEAAAFRVALARERERADRAEGERDALQKALQAARAAAEDAGRRARIAEEQTAAAHRRAAEVTAAMGRVAEGLEQIRKTQATAAEAAAPDPAELEAVQARAAEAERQAADARRRAEEAERRAAAANERFDRFQQRRIAEAQEAAARASEAAEVARLEAEARRPLWRRLFRRRAGRAP